MEPIPIVRRRSRILPLLLVLIVLAIAVAGVWFMMGGTAMQDVGLAVPQGLPDGAAASSRSA